MPKRNRYEAAGVIREQLGGREIVRIAVTGWGQEEDRRRSEEVRMYVHAVKQV